MLPIEPLPFMASEEKSKSKISFFSFGRGLWKILRTSASPFGFAVNQSNELPSFPCVRSYSLSRVIPVTANLLTKTSPFLPSLYTQLYIQRSLFLLNTPACTILRPINAFSDIFET